MKPDPEQVEAFRVLLEKDQAARYARDYPNVTPPRVKVHYGRRWIRVDVGDSGVYMIDQDGSIVGIKAYGVPHLGHRYGTLDTIHEWAWGEYKAWRAS